MTDSQKLGWEKATLVVWNLLTMSSERQFCGSKLFLYQDLDNKRTLTSGGSVLDSDPKHFSMMTERDVPEPSDTYSIISHLP